MTMNPGIREACLALIVFGFVSASVAETPDAAACRTINVTVASGRTFTAEVDRQTDSDTLWLRWARAGMVIQQPISWDRVTEVSVDGRRMSAAEFAQTLALQPPAAANPQEDQKTTIVIGSWARKQEQPSVVAATTMPRDEPSLPRQPGRVQSLAIQAGLTNCSSTAEIDGLVVEVSPLDAAGTLTAVRGVLEVEMIGQEATNMRPGREFPVLGRWVERVEIDDFAYRGARYALALRPIRPAADRTLSPLATVRARLTVPGQGVFEATTTARIPVSRSPVASWQ